MTNGFFTSLQPVESNMRNSYMALMIYKNLESPVPLPLIKFFSSEFKYDKLSDGDLYCLLKGRRVLGLSSHLLSGVDRKLSLTDKYVMYNIINHYETGKLSEQDKMRIVSFLKNLKNSDGG